MFVKYTYKCVHSPFHKLISHVSQDIFIKIIYNIESREINKINNKIM